VLRAAVGVILRAGIAGIVLFVPKYNFSRINFGKCFVVAHLFPAVVGFILRAPGAASVFPGRQPAAFIYKQFIRASFLTATPIIMFTAGEALFLLVVPIKALPIPRVLLAFVLWAVVLLVGMAALALVLVLVPHCDGAVVVIAGPELSRASFFWTRANVVLVAAPAAPVAP